MTRYSRQILFEGIGAEGQQLLGASRVLIVGCGALGSAQAEGLARAGVGRLRVVDRDFVEQSNLHRQTLFTERDAAERLPKAVAGARRLAQINAEVNVEGVVADVHRGNVEALIKDCDVVLDGTDNFQTRYLINDACVKHGVNWIYGAAVGSYGVTMTVRPHATPCLRCVFGEAPGAGGAPTCDTAGVILPIIHMIAAVQITEAFKLITRHETLLHNALLQFDVWRSEWRRIALGAPDARCPTCAGLQFDTLGAESAQVSAVLCGRDAVQIAPPAPVKLDLIALASRLRKIGEVKSNAYLLRFSVGEYELSVFLDGRAIVRGTNDITLARSLYAKYIGT
ncbi:MAG: ThiF family adenylyltransferase [Pyrinomonadaceae bacterium]